ncbi:hypothetical protein JOM56_009878 [Amanita muscaria]
MEVTKDVQNCLDALGVAAFGHDLEVLEGSPSNSIGFSFSTDHFHRCNLSHVLEILNKPSKAYAKYRNAISTTAKKIVLNERKKRKLSSPGLDVIETSLLDMIVKENSAGKEIESGTMIKLFFNTPEELWGPDAKRFIPDRWLRELTSPAKDKDIFTHSLTGQESTLSVFIRNTFELEDGLDTVFDYHGALLSRPKPVGKVPHVFGLVKAGVSEETWFQ